MKIVLRYLLLFLLVMQSGAGTVFAEEVKLRHVLSFYTGEKGDGMKLPEDVACDGKAGILVADTGNGRLLRYTLEEGKIKKVSEIRTPEMAAPIRVKVNSQEEIFVLDNRQHILRFNPQGLFQGYLGYDGMPASATVMPVSFTIGPQDELYVLDVFSARVLVLNRAGAYQRQISLPGDIGFVSDIAVDAKGRVPRHRQREIRSPRRSRRCRRIYAAHGKPEGPCRIPACPYPGPPGDALHPGPERRRDRHFPARRLFPGTSAGQRVERGTPALSFPPLHQ